MATVSTLHEGNEVSTVLVNDLNTWWSGKTWSWRLEKTETENPSPMEASAPSKESDTFGSVGYEKVPPSTSKELEERSKIETGACTRDQMQCDTSVLSSEHSLNCGTPLSFIQPNITSTGRSPLHSVQPFFEIRHSSTGGYGAFAIQDINPYTIILKESALLEASNAEFMEKFEKLSPEEQIDFMNLACFEKISRDKRRATFKTNRFYTATGRNGIFRIACRFNHSCLPQVVYHYSRTENKLVLSTRHFIRKGKEMFISYGQNPETLLLHYGFICSCGSCSPIEPQELKPEQWEVEYWQKKTSSEEAKDQFSEWGMELTDGTECTEGTSDIVDGWGADFTGEIRSQKETHDACIEW